MFARIEVAMRPEFPDPAAAAFLRKVELVDPALRAKIRWARMLDVFWLDVPVQREELITGITEIYWDKVLQWLFTGNLIPSAAGKQGGLLDIMESAPNRPGKFWALERRFRGGVTDNIGRTSIEAFEIVLGKPIPKGHCASGSFILLEGPQLNEDSLAAMARDVFCNELIETWTMHPEEELKNNNRFHQERIKQDIPKILVKGSDKVETVKLSQISDVELEKLSKKNLWALSLAEMKAVRDHFSDADVTARRQTVGLGDPTDAEVEIIAQTWSEHCKHKIFNARIRYSEKGPEKGDKRQVISAKIPAEIDGLFKATISGTTAELPKPWLLSVFSDNAGIVAFDAEDAICIKVETHNTPSALDPYGGALTGIVGVNRDILGCGLGAKPIFNTNVFCLAPPDYSKPLPERLLHPRRILDGVRRGVEHGGNKSGIPTVNGALVFDDRYLGKPLIYCGTGGIMPRTSAGRKCELKEIESGDHIFMIGGRIGKDGIHGATFSSLALDESSPSSAVQLGDPITQKRVSDFLLEARDLGFYRAVTDNGAGGLSSSVGEMARLSGGARMDVSRAKVKYAGLKPFELIVSESQERMTLAVPPQKAEVFKALAEKRGVEWSDLGEFNDSGRFDVYFAEKLVASLDLEFLHHGTPKLTLEAVWTGPPPAPKVCERSFQVEGSKVLIELLGRPNIASKEWMISQYDHEVQGTSVIKPLHTVAPGTAQAVSGPNDAAVLKPKPSSEAGIAVGCGINPKFSDIDPYLMAQAAVDESIRNILCVGAEFGKPEHVVALVDNFCWPDPVVDPLKASWLVRACFGLRDAACALSAPLISGKDSMKNDYRGQLNGQDIVISVPPTLLMTAIARVPDVRYARSADFKNAGDVIYLIGGMSLGLWGSEFHSLYPSLPNHARFGEPHWETAKKIYSWIGGDKGRELAKLKSLHDVSEGGILVAVAEGLIARGIGASIELPQDMDCWEAAFGEGFHSFIASVGDIDAAALETELTASGVPFKKLGTVIKEERLEVKHQNLNWSLALKEIRAAWKKEGYWE